MDDKCTYEYCYAPDSSCNLGEIDLADCPHWKETAKKSKSGESIGGAAETEDSRLLPWSGNSLGTVDLEFIASRSKPSVIGVVGSHNAGKTTLLTAFYLLLSKGHRLPNHTFAGSYTFGGWENLADPLRWHSGQSPKFPPHTSSNAGRLPGLLHLAFRDRTEAHRDMLFTDAPGEWFERWSIEKDAPDAEGARWINRYADSFMLFADSAALSGPTRGEARIRLITQAQRLSDEIAGRPVAIIWSKSDIEIPEGIKGSLRKYFQRLFPICSEFSVSVHFGESPSVTTHEEFLRLLAWLLNYKESSTAPILSIPVALPNDHLLAFRG